MARARLFACSLSLLAACAIDRTGRAPSNDAGRRDTGVDAMADARDGSGDVGTTDAPNDADADAPPDVRSCELCPLGCAPGSNTECRRYVPSNQAGDVLAMAGDDFGNGPIMVGPPYNQIFIHSDDGEINALHETEGFLQLRPAMPGEYRGMYFGLVDVGGVSIGVLVVREVSVAAGSLLTVHGTKPLVVLARQDVVIDGVVQAGQTYTDVSMSVVAIPGPGGGQGGAAGTDGISGAMGGGSGGGSGGITQTGTDGAAGGGGFGTRGGVGGCSIPECRAASGATYGDSLVPLVGGSGGGGGGDFGGRGGHGGGAIQLSAFGRIAIGSTGVIDASGEGGQSGTTRGGGGGGGSGGAIFLEAPTIEVAGVLGVMGGGGGGGQGSGAGARWGYNPPYGTGYWIAPPITIPAPGGGSTVGAVTPGGAGSNDDGIATDGTSNDLSDGGGGGGGSGRIRILTVGEPIGVERAYPRTAVSMGTLVPAG